MSILSFRGQHELSSGLRLQQKDQNHVAINNCFHARSQMRANDAIVPTKFWIANTEPLSKDCHDRVKPIIHSTNL